ncbi:MAG: BrxA family protein [bacterium]
MLSQKPKYNMNFTVGSLLIYPSIEFISLYLKYRDWIRARKEALELNITQSDKTSSASRILTEIKSRLVLLSDAQLEFFNTANLQDKLYLLILALSKKYRLIYDFLIHLHQAYREEKIINFTKRNFDIFFNDKTIYYPELISIEAARLLKFRRYTFKSLQEARILDENSNVLGAYLSKDFINIIAAEDKQDLLILPRIN